MRFLCPAVETGKKLNFNILQALCPRQGKSHTSYNSHMLLAQRLNTEKEQDNLPLSELAQRLKSAGNVNHVVDSTESVE